PPPAAPYTISLHDALPISLQVLGTAEQHLDKRKQELEAAMKALEGDIADPIERARLELARDQRLRDVQLAEDRYQISKDWADNLDRKSTRLNSSHVKISYA